MENKNEVFSMKKILTAVLCLTLLLALCGCGKEETAPQTTQTPATTVPATTEAAKTYAGLTATFIGDSITNGAKLNIGEPRYWEILKTELSLGDVTGMGVNGSCYSTNNDRGHDYSPLVDRYQQVPGTDLIFIFMGTNDFSHETPLGTTADTTDISLCGAMNLCLDGIAQKNPQSRIILVTPIIRYDLGQNDVGLSLQEYVDAVKSVAQARQLPVIDLYSLTKDSLPEGLFSDKVHPDKYGHQILAKAMKTWLEENIDTILG